MTTVISDNKMFEYGPPNWEKVYEEYYSLEKPKFNSCYEIIDKELTQLSQPVTDQDVSNMNRALTTRELKDLYESKFDLYAERIEIDIYKDGNFTISRRRFSDSREGNLLPVFVDFSFFSVDSRSEYVRNSKEIEEYFQENDNLTTLEKIRLWRDAVGYKSGHNSVCMLNTDNRVYDFFETSNTIAAKYRVAVAMEKFYGAIESKESKFLTNSRDGVCLQQGELKHIIGEKNNLCNLYSLAYIACRLVCNSHLAIWQYFEKKERILLVYLVIGIFKK